MRILAFWLFLIFLFILCLFIDIHHRFITLLRLKHHLLRLRLHRSWSPDTGRNTPWLLIGLLKCLGSLVLLLWMLLGIPTHHLIGSKLWLMLLHVALMRVLHLLWILIRVSTPSTSPAKSASATPVIASSPSFASITATLLHHHMIVVVVGGAHSPSSSWIHTRVLLWFTSCTASGRLGLAESTAEVATTLRWLLGREGWTGVSKVETWKSCRWWITSTEIITHFL